MQDDLVQSASWPRQRVKLPSPGRVQILYQA